MTKKLRRVSLLQSNRKTSSEESFNYHKGMHHTRVLPLLFLEYAPRLHLLHLILYSLFFFLFIFYSVLLSHKARYSTTDNTVCSSAMEKHQYVFLLFFSIIIVSLGLVSFVSCIIAESKKVEKEDVKLDNKLCYLPESRALGFGIAALACLIVAQTIGNVVICCNLCLRKDGDTCKARKAKTATAFLVLSWVSFGAAAILLSTATSMGREQEYGKGWLDQECYLVKDRVYFGSGFLVLLSIAATLVSVLFSIRKTQGEQGRKIHAQVV